MREQVVSDSQPFPGQNGQLTEKLLPLKTSRCNTKDKPLLGMPEEKRYKKISAINRIHDSKVLRTEYTKGFAQCIRFCNDKK